MAMALQCNINAKGKAIRLAYGFALVIGGIVLAWLWAWPSGSAWAWVICGAAVGGGAFAVFEGWAGWCVVRALGFRTPV